MIAGVVILHVWALHVSGQNNPIGVDPKSEKDTVKFTPYATVKDGFGVALFVVMFGLFVFYMPNSLGDVNNYIPANPLVTPEHIVPEWYYLPFYAILRAIPNKLMGVLAMFGSIGVLFILPWLDTSKVRSMRFRPKAQIFFVIFVINALILGWCGHNPPDKFAIPVGEGGLTFVWLSRIGTAYWFAYFVIIMPLLGIVEKTRPVPDTISSPVLSGAATVEKA